MKTELMRLLAGVLLVLSFCACYALEVEWHEERTPWGELQERFQYYQQDGEKIKHGECETFRENGEMLGRSHYRHGKLHGQVQSFYEGKPAQVHESYTFDEGLQHGLEIQWSPEGNKLWECHYQNGEPLNGRTMTSGSSSHGEFTRKYTCVTWEYRDGKRIPSSKEVITYAYEIARELEGPDFSKFIKWRFYSYEIDSSYPYLKRLPDYEQIPFLIDWCSKGQDSSDVSHSQLVTLSRCDFAKTKLGALKEEDYTPWRVWWDHFGKHLPEKENAEGVKDIEAWQVACRRRRRLPIPDELLYLPSSYRVVFSFRSGDYQGKVREDMILTRSPEAAELRRTFSTITDGPVQTQYWANFSIDKADMVTRAILYVIDHPWLTLDEDRINREYAAHPRPGERDDKWFSLPKTPKIPGRESFSNYYPSATFQIEDSDGRILANDDPRGFWDGGNHDRFNHGDPVGGSLIYAFFTKLFPENTISSVDEVEGWRDVQ